MFIYNYVYKKKKKTKDLSMIANNIWKDNRESSLVKIGKKNIDFMKLQLSDKVNLIFV